VGATVTVTLALPTAGGPWGPGAGIDMATSYVPAATAGFNWDVLIYDNTARIDAFYRETFENNNKRLLDWLDISSSNFRQHGQKQPAEQSTAYVTAVFKDGNVAHDSLDFQVVWRPADYLWRVLDARLGGAAADPRIQQILDAVKISYGTF